MKLTIDMSKPKKAISPMLYGIFFEDINRAADGGLYAELIANGSFDSPKDEHGNDMSLANWETSGDISAEVWRKRTEAKPNYLHLYSKDGGGIVNLGFGNDGFGVHTDERFTISFSARLAGGDETVLSARLVSDGRHFAEGSIMIKGDARWHNYSIGIKSLTTKPHARLELYLPMGGEMDIDNVSMFPQNTFRRRKNGMRRDIAKLIRDIKPKFMRFPGGCVVEGRSIETMYNWKKSIGDISRRIPNKNRWQADQYQYRGTGSQDYFQSLGIGFYEYFIFCEDIGAEPVPVVNCGMTCQWHEGLLVPLDELEPWIQDVLDLIEFANGDISTEWGKKRAQMGHKEPFGLKYVAIGNEQWGEQYFERYERFYDAISKQHPEIMLITSAGWDSEGKDFDTAVKWMKNNREKAFAVDEHFYKSPEWFLSNVRRYDGYDRTMPKVFAGEYACHTSKSIEERRNNWYAAVCEAAFLTGVENNADHVWMACYAPLLAKEGFDQWKPDLIWFDNLSAYGTPSYYVQKEFSRHYGSELIEAVSDDAEVFVSATADGERGYIKIVNTSSEPKTAKLEFIGADARGYSAEAVIIRSEPEAENSIENPTAVVPGKTVIPDLNEAVCLQPYEVMIITFA